MPKVKVPETPLTLNAINEGGLSRRRGQGAPLRSVRDLSALPDEIEIDDEDERKEKRVPSSCD